MRKIVLLSGGLDSSTLLNFIKDDETEAIFFDYGQKAVGQERKAARKIAESVGVPLIEKDLVNIYSESNSSLISNDKPITIEYHIDGNASYISDTTEVENRNALLLMATVTVAMQRYPNQCVKIYYGATKIRVPFEDCKPLFVLAMNQVVTVVSNGRIDIEAPFIDKGKDEVFEIAKQTGTKIEDTWSCYEGKEKPCGVCPQCIDRFILGGEKC